MKKWWESPTAALGALCGEKAEEELREALQESAKAEYQRGYEDGKESAVVYAHWERWEDWYGDVCSHCFKASAPENGYNYCPWCGAKMDEVQDD